MVAKLHGDFAFVLHDSRLVRTSLYWPADKALQYTGAECLSLLSPDLLALRHS